MSVNTILNNIIIKKEHFNTKFLYYNYYQFKKTKSIVINYRTPYCTLDGIYLDCNNIYLKSVIKRVNNKSFILELIIPSNHDIVTIFDSINEFNNKFFENIKLEINVKKRKTLKSSTYINKDKTHISYIDDNMSRVNIAESPDEEDNKSRFDKINNIYSLNKTYYYTNFLQEYKNENINGYIIACEIKSEFCQKLFYKLKSDLLFSKTQNSNSINICNEIIKSCNQEYFEFKNYSNSWNCENWNIALDCKVKCSSFVVNNDNNNLNMIWKLCSISS